MDGPYLNSQLHGKWSDFEKDHPSTLLHKGQLNSERIYEVIVSPKIPTKNFKDFCPTL